MTEAMLESRYGHFHPSYQAETRRRIDRQENVAARSVGSVFGADDLKPRAA